MEDYIKKIDSSKNNIHSNLDEAVAISEVFSELEDSTLNYLINISDISQEVQTYVSSLTSKVNEIQSSLASKVIEIKDSVIDLNDIKFNPAEIAEPSDDKLTADEIPTMADVIESKEVEEENQKSSKDYTEIDMELLAKDITKSFYDFNDKTPLKVDLSEISDSIGEASLNTKTSMEDMDDSQRKSFKLQRSNFSKLFKTMASPLTSMLPLVATIGTGVVALGALVGLLSSVSAVKRALDSLSDAFQQEFEGRQDTANMTYDAIKELQEKLDAVPENELMKERYKMIEEGDAAGAYNGLSKEQRENLTQYSKTQGSLGRIEATHATVQAERYANGEISDEEIEESKSEEHKESDKELPREERMRIASMAGPAGMMGFLAHEKEITALNVTRDAEKSRNEKFLKGREAEAVAKQIQEEEDLANRLDEENLIKQNLQQQSELEARNAANTTGSQNTTNTTKNIFNQDSSKEIDVLERVYGQLQLQTKSTAMLAQAFASSASRQQTMYTNAVVDDSEIQMFKDGVQ